MQKLSAVALVLALLPGTALPQSACLTPPVIISHAAGSSNNDPDQLVFINTTQYPGAICNDGSPAAFIIRQGLSLSANRWVIHLAEGGDCTSGAACLARYNSNPDTMGTGSWGRPGFPNQVKANDTMGYYPWMNVGILSPFNNYNPDFWDATIVQVLYCSQDYFTGNRPAQGAFAPAAIQTWGFNGRAILAAVIATLNQPQFGLANATEVLFTGSSAGAMGVFMNLNNPALAFPPNARLVALADAGFSQYSFPQFSHASKVPPYEATTTPTTMQSDAMQGLGLWNGSGDQNCAAEATTEAAQVLCYDPSYVMNNGFIHTPTFIAQSNYDTAELVADGVSKCMITVSCSPANANQAKADAYMNAYAANMLSEMQTVPMASPAASFVAQSVVHTLTDGFASNAKGSYFTTNFDLSNSNQTVTVAGLFGTWYRSPCTFPASSATLTTTPQLNF